MNTKTKICAFIKANGQHCGGRALSGSRFCFWHGQGKKAAKQRAKATTRPRVRVRTRSISGSAPVEPSVAITKVQRLDEQYRPRSFDDIVGQNEAVRKVRTVLGRGWGGRAFWIAGESGTGKTTLAKIIAGMGVLDVDTGDSFGRVVETVGRELSPSSLKAITFNWMFSGGHALIVNEAHGLNRVMIEHFLNLLEGLRANVVVIFTTTNEGQDLFDEKLDAGPFASRCVCVNLTNKNLTRPLPKNTHAEPS